MTLDPAGLLPDHGRMARLFSAMPAAAQIPDEQRQLDWVRQRGRILFEIDRSARVTTDDMRQRLGDPARAGAHGWTVERDCSGYVVNCLGGEGEARASVYRGRVEGNRLVSAQLFAAGARPPLTAAQRRLARSALNVAVIPLETPDGPLDLYVLTPQTRTGACPFSGRSRATVSPSGVQSTAKP